MVTLLSTFDETGTPTEFYHQFDAQHSTNALIAPDCDVVQTYKYQAFGLPAGNSDVGWGNLTAGDWAAMDADTWASLPADGAQTDIRFAFGGQAGYSYETELGLYLLGMGAGGQRLMNPATGRFTSEDSIRQAGGTLNLYQYERNDPIVNVDPSGEELVQRQDGKYYWRVEKGDVASKIAERLTGSWRNYTKLAKPRSGNYHDLATGEYIQISDTPIAPLVRWGRFGIGGHPAHAALGQMLKTKDDWTRVALARANINPDEWNPKIVSLDVGPIETEFSPELYDRPSNFLHALRIAVRVYRYYQHLYNTNHNFIWAGMAVLAGSSVIQGILDAYETRNDISKYNLSGRQLMGIGATLPQPLQGAANLPANIGTLITQFVISNLLLMQQEIFFDLAWQHEAYLAGGISEIKAHHDAGEITPRNFEAWQLIDHGIKTANVADVWAGNTLLLRREQEIALARGYSAFAKWPVIAQTMTKQIKNPIPGGAAFTGSDITDFLQRWPWIKSQMVEPFRKMTPEERTRLINERFTG